MRSWLYRLARLMGDYQAALKGPAALLRRLARKAVYRHANKGLARLLRRGGL